MNGEEKILAILEKQGAMLFRMREEQTQLRKAGGISPGFFDRLSRLFDRPSRIAGHSRVGRVILRTCIHNRETPSQRVFSRRSALRKH